MTLILRCWSCTRRILSDDRTPPSTGAAVREAYESFKSVATRLLFI